MKNYKISKEALKDLDFIWLYTKSYWSENQAVLYFRRIISAIKLLLGSYFYIGTPYDHICKGLRGLKVGKHIIFYRRDNDTLLIVRILHERMDPDRHIN